MLGGLGLWAPGLLTPLKFSPVPLEVTIPQLEESWCRLASLDMFSLSLIPSVSRDLEVGAHASKETSSFLKEMEEKICGGLEGRSLEDMNL